MSGNFENILIATIAAFMLHIERRVCHRVIKSRKRCFMKIRTKAGKYNEIIAVLNRQAIISLLLHACFSDILGEKLEKIAKKKQNN